MKKKRSSLGPVLVTLGLLLAACGSAAQPGPVAPSQPASASSPASAVASKPSAVASQKPLKHVSLRLASPQLDASKANVAIAQTLGYFAQEGLEVEYGTVAQGVGEASQMLASGAIDYVNGGPDAVLAAEARGQDLGLVFFYNEIHASIFSAAAVLPDSPIKDYSDLKGKKVGVLSLDPGPTLLPKAIVREKGLDPESDISWIAIGAGAQAFTAIQRKQVDAGFFWDTAYAGMENLGAQFRYLSASSQVSSISYTGNLTTRTTLQNNRDESIGLGRALAKGIVFFLANPELSVRIL